jgi:hypothetical protein
LVEELDADPVRDGHPPIDATVRFVGVSDPGTEGERRRS